MQRSVYVDFSTTLSLVRKKSDECEDSSPVHIIATLIEQKARRCICVYIYTYIGLKVYTGTSDIRSIVTPLFVNGNEQFREPSARNHRCLVPYEIIN